MNQPHSVGYQLEHADQVIRQMLSWPSEERHQVCVKMPVKQKKKPVE